MSTVLVIHRADGGLSVLKPVKPEALDAQAELAKWHASYGGPEPLGVLVVEESTLPAGPVARLFRNAWRLVDLAVVVSLPHARAIRLRELEEKKKEVLSKLRDAIEAAEDRLQPAIVAALKARRSSLREFDFAPPLAGMETPTEIAEYAGPDSLTDPAGSGSVVPN